jgi:hypothetical protein
VLFGVDAGRLGFTGVGWTTGALLVNSSATSLGCFRITESMHLCCENKCRQYVMTSLLNSILRR